MNYGGDFNLCRSMLEFFYTNLIRGNTYEK